MRWLYGVVIWLYGSLIRLAGMWHRKARLLDRGRREIWGRLATLDAGDGPVLWCHCASLGEFEQGRPLVEAFLDRKPGWRLLLTFFSPSGYQVRANYPRAACVCYLPLDTRGRMRRFVREARPSICVLVKYELWPNLLGAVREAGVPTYLVAGHFRAGQVFFRWWGGWFRGLLRPLAWLFAQDEEGVGLLRGIGVARCSVAGDTRFDRVCAAATSGGRCGEAATLAHGHQTLVAGSTWPPDEEALLHVAKEMPPEWRLILVPHEIEPQRIARWRSRVGIPSLLYSEKPTEEQLSATRILIVDTVGLLLSIYKEASLAYVGGGFGVGIHNLLEPAACGVPVVWGRNSEAFREANGLLKAKGGIRVTDHAALPGTIVALMKNQEQLAQMGRNATDYVMQNTGATERILARICPDSHKTTNQ